ncbi:hypothetical protein [Metasolibacillus meyeri]|uniref:hypothetical protein n=1 Tax=Metasolibacillus meyeri TaxID=1071052 RepID=UPI000D31C3B1|nr:hypothetical protein [Metasolibacillus meyeri]
MRQYKLGDIVTIAKGIEKPPTASFASEGIPFVTSEHWGWLTNIGCLPKIPHTVQHSMYLTRVPVGAILISPFENAYHICQQELYIGKNMVAIIPYQRIILSEYLFYYLQVQPWKVEEIDQQIVYLPEIEIQQQFIAHVIQLEAIVEQVQNILTALPQLEQYMLTENMYLLKLQKEQKELIEQFKWMGDIHKVLLNNMLELRGEP